MTIEKTRTGDVIPLREATRAWFAISLQTFGSPAGQIAVMQHKLVDEKRWIGQRRFLHALNYCMLLPGPETQHFDAQHVPAEDGRQIRFKRLEAGEELAGTFLTGFVTPGPDYWLAEMTTAKVGATESLADSNDWDNDGKLRYYKPKFLGEPYSIDMSASGQIARLGGGASPYIEGQITVWHSGADVDGSPSTRARYFAFRGKVLRELDGEPEDTIQVAICEFVDAPNYGNVGVGVGVQPALRIVQWLDPRPFGFNHRKLDLAYWTGVGSGDGRIEACPLNAYAWRLDDEVEFAHTLLPQVMLSTGSSPGYDTAGAITDGDNSPGGALAGVNFWCSDLELADLGLGIPHQLVAPISEFFAGFNAVPGGWAGPLNRVRYAYIGPFLAQDMISSLLRVRRLMLRLHGGRIGVVRLAPFSPSEAEVTIEERDLYDDEPPEQLPAPVGQLDEMRLSYRWDPLAGRTQLEHTERARDPDARSRTGELFEAIAEHGLLPWGWSGFSAVGTSPWYDEIRLLWAYEAAVFFSLDHYQLTFLVSRPKGQDLAPGTRVLLSNPWPADNAGGYGLTNHVGIVTAVELDTATHARRVEVFVFAGQGAGYRYFAPMARVLEQVGTTLTLSTDQYGHGNAAIQDGDGFARPSWSTAGTDVVAQILYRIGHTWSLGGQHDVVRWDPDTATLDLATAPDTSIQYADRWVLIATYDNQGAADYPRDTFGAVCLDDLTHGAGPTAARPFHP